METTNDKETVDPTLLKALAAAQEAYDQSIGDLDDAKEDVLNCEAFAAFGKALETMQARAEALGRARVAIDSAHNITSGVDTYNHKTGRITRGVKAPKDTRATSLNALIQLLRRGPGND